MSSRERPVDVSASQGVLAGDHGTQNNYYYVDSAARAVAGTEADVVVVGDVPQEPAAFQARAGLMDALEHRGGSRVRVVFAVTGIRGVGKTQVAAAYARRRITEGWRLVAWVDASDEASLLSGLSQVATAAELGPAGEDARLLAAEVRRWLEADGERRLLIFDNTLDLDVLRPFLPAGGAAQVIVTSSRRSAASLGASVPVDLFTEGEALAFLAERTGLDDSAGARELAAELGFLPLGLAQAAALIAREHLDYCTYVERLQGLPVAGYLRRAEGESYPYRLAEAVTLSLRAVEARDPSGVCGRLMGLVAVLAETGVSRRVLYLATGIGALGDGEVGSAEVDASLGDLSDASLLGFTMDDKSVVGHRLVMRVVRERLAAEGLLLAAMDGAVQVLTGWAQGFSEVWRDPAGVRELAGQVEAVMVRMAVHADVFTARMPEGLLRLRLRSAYLLNTLGDSTGLAVLAAEPLVADCEHVLGVDHPDTLSARDELARAYMDAGRTVEAIPLLERTLADRERFPGIDYQTVLASRNNLAMAYVGVGRTVEAIPLLERVLADCEWELGTDHPSTLTARNNLASAYSDARWMADAIRLFERTVADTERVLGTDHPSTLGSKNNLAMAYVGVGRTVEAIPLLERVLADYERVLGTDHPSTLTARANVAGVYRDEGLTEEAISLFERVLADREWVLGTEHPKTESTRANLMLSYDDAGRSGESRSLLLRLLDDYKRGFGTEYPNV